MKIIRTVREMQQEAESIRNSGKTIGFVPTMGYLHEGHLSLLRIAKQQSDILVLSIYVNPTQFAPNEDLDKYPRNFERDEQLAQSEGVDIIFYPDNTEIYPEGFQTWVEVENLPIALCGQSRPHHFRGVTTICAKLFLAVKPHIAVFGQKDFQQARIIQQMVKDLNMDLKIIVGPIVRESDGLAMSSRNKYLSKKEREDALSLSEALEMGRNLILQGEKATTKIKQTMADHMNQKANIKIDYIEIVDTKTLRTVERIETKTLIALAVFAGKTRLIDNIVMEK